MKTKRINKAQLRSAHKKRAVTSLVKMRRLDRGHNSSVYTRVLLNPLVAFGCLCVGVLMTSWTCNVIAATVITTTIEAPVLTVAATITSPIAGSTYDQPLLTVVGTCPIYSYVKVSINNLFRAVAWCDSAGNYSVLLSLTTGGNNIMVQDYNTTDLAGPTSSDSVLVIYAPTATPGSVAALPSGISSNPPRVGANGSTKTESIDSNVLIPDAPLLLTSTFNFYTFKIQQAFDWEMNVSGGQPPYNIYVNWGDEKVTKYYFATDPSFWLHHSYAQQGYYKVSIESVDSTQSIHVMQLAALITNADGKASFLGSTKQDMQPQNLVTHFFKQLPPWVYFATPAIILLMCVSFWLGMRRKTPPASHKKMPNDR